MNLRFAYSTDYELIAAMMTNGSVYRRMVNDSAPVPEDLLVGPIAEIEYVVGFENECPVALFLLAGNKHSESVAQVHFCFDPQMWGRTGDIAQAFLEWVWCETGYMRLVGPVPSHNRLCHRLALAVGFEQYAVQENAGTRNGIPFDLLYLEIERPVAKGAGA